MARRRGRRYGRRGGRQEIMVRHFPACLVVSLVCTALCQCRFLHHDRTTLISVSFFTIRFSCRLHLHSDIYIFSLFFIPLCCHPAPVDSIVFAIVYSFLFLHLSRLAQLPKSCPFASRGNSSSLLSVCL
jgi:hypothetical protein